MSPKEYRGTLNEELWPTIFEAFQGKLEDRPLLRALLRALEEAGLFTKIEPPPSGFRSSLSDKPEQYYMITDQELSHIAQTVDVVLSDRKFGPYGPDKWIPEAVLRLRRTHLFVGKGFSLEIQLTPEQKAALGRGEPIALTPTSLGGAIKVTIQTTT